jgi:Trk K+ transport system NAD-binding subunit
VYKRQIGKFVRDLPLPEESLLTTVRRGNKVILLHGDTVIQDGDQLTAVTGSDCASQLLSIFESTGTWSEQADSGLEEK